MTLGEPKRFHSPGSFGYIGSVRNAANHDGDVDINNNAWRIRDATGLEYASVACSFIAAPVSIERNASPENLITDLKHSTSNDWSQVSAALSYRLENVGRKFEAHTQFANLLDGELSLSSEKH